MDADNPLQPYGWYTADALRRWLATWRAFADPEGATDADIRKARTCRCPQCNKAAQGATAFRRGPGWKPVILAVCPDCNTFGDLVCL